MASSRVARQRGAAMAAALAATVVVVTLGTVLLGCGPVGYVNQVTRKASTAVDEARSVGADRLSPYWWTRAVEYLHQARVEAAAADWQAANRFGRLATAAAEQARADAIRRAADPRAMEEITPPPVSPARGEGGLAPATADEDAP